MATELSPQVAVQQANEGQLIFLDVRSAREYAGVRPAAAYNFPYHGRNWGAMVERALQGQKPPMALFAGDAEVAEAARRELEGVGLEVVFVWDRGIEAWKEAGLPTVEVADVTVDELAQDLERYEIIDVREPYEHRMGVIPGARLIPMNQLPEVIGTLDPSRPYAIVCASGSRSASVAAWMSQQGFKVANVVGGMNSWMRARHPITRP
ncbi:MAG: rhodanese-like domain-containing protein [Firmicutes bacterium]|nr:rhodanese-like domain-containing protein [Bacillota bacterium]